MKYSEVVIDLIAIIMFFFMVNLGFFFGWTIEKAVCCLLASVCVVFLVYIRGPLYLQLFRSNDNQVS